MKENEKISSEEVSYLKKELERLKHIELKYNVLLNAIPNMAWFTDTDSNYQDVNKSFINHCGKNIDDIKGNSHKYVWKDKIGNECRENDLTVFKSKEGMVFEEVVPGKEGYKHYNIHRVPVIDESGSVIGIIAVASDTTEIENREAQLKILIENIPFRVWLCDKDGTYIKTNSKFAKAKNKTLNQIVGKNIRQFYSEEETKEILKEDMEVINSKKSIKFTKDILEKGKTRTVEIYKTPVLDVANEVVGIVGTLVDITNLKEAESKIRKQAYTDSHTGLFNRRGLYAYLNNIEKGSCVTTFIIDTDNFKYINDTYGHYAGDKVLKSISKVLVKLCKRNHVFRFGGDEFIVVFEGEFCKDKVLNLAQQIISEISNITVGLNNEESISISMGIAYGIQNCKNDNHNLINNADIALYKAKELGKNRYVVYKDSL